jgi:hypothetical protein
MSIKRSIGSSKGKHSLALDIGSHARLKHSVRRKIDFPTEQIRQAIFQPHQIDQG